MKKTILSAVALLAASAAPALAGPNLVLNGGFEDVTTAQKSGFEINYAGTVDHWASSVSHTNTSGVAFNVLFPSATAASVSPLTRYTAGERQYLATEHYGGASPNGGNFVAIDGDSNYSGYLYQNIGGLTAGQTYKLTFSWAGTQFDNRTGETTERVAYNLGSAFDFDPSLTGKTTATVVGATHYFNGWNTVTSTFTATGANQFLSFLSIGTPAGLPPVALIDGVSLNAVPEPASWALMLFGFGGLGMAARRRRRGMTTVTA